ncbi:MAG: N(6)-L-threonylcarbamoyladenine synthase TsaD [Subtercola sp.]|nr:N(6)-L-threonylcarbamoyladenine synthase TsaD [Subtercola sp.]
MSDASTSASATPDWNLRVAGPADLDAIMALETSTFESDAWSPAMMLADLGHRHTYYLVAEKPPLSAAGSGIPAASHAATATIDGTATTASHDATAATAETVADASALTGHPLPPFGGYGGLLSPQGAADADIQTIAVSPDARGRGLGRRLMQALIAEAARRGARRVFLEVRADNPGAQHLYRTLGFTEIGVRRGYYQPDDVDAVVMRLDLDASQSSTSASASAATKTKTKTSTSRKGVS